MFSIRLIAVMINRRRKVSTNMEWSLINSGDTCDGTIILAK